MREIAPPLKTPLAASTTCYFVPASGQHFTVPAKRPPFSSRSENDSVPDRPPFSHQFEPLIDLFEPEFVGDEVVDVDLLLHVPIDNSRHVAAALGATERGSLPHAPRYQLKWPRPDFLSRAGDADDGRDAPALVATLQRLAHHVYVADAFE